MFLFSTAPKSAEPAKARPLTDVVRAATDNSGVSYDYLMKTAKRESNLDPAAKARTSSASGLYQFLDQTWLATVKTEGAKFGLDAEAQQITQSSSGRLNVEDAGKRKKILDLRHDPVVSSKLAAAFTLRNQAQLTDNLGRSPSEGELYIAHFLGAKGASDLIRLASENPDAQAAASFPDAAGSNRPVFYEKSGKAKSIAEVYSSLVSQYNVDNLSIENAVQTAVISPLDSAYRAKAGGKPMFGLFNADESGPVAQPIQATWKNVGRNLYGTGGKQLASLNSNAFYPNSKESGAKERDAKEHGTKEYAPSDVSSLPALKPVTSTADSPTALIPLPPDKPTNLTSTNLASTLSKKQRFIRAPLNLLSFLRQPV